MDAFNDDSGHAIKLDDPARKLDPEAARAAVRGVD
jgi:hypothetical protein